MVFKVNLFWKLEKKSVQPPMIGQKSYETKFFKFTAAWQWGQLISWAFCVSAWVWPHENDENFGPMWVRTDGKYFWSKVVRLKSLHHN